MLPPIVDSHYTPFGPRALVGSKRRHTRPILPLHGLDWEENAYSKADHGASALYADALSTAGSSGVDRPMGTAVTGLSLARWIPVHCTDPPPGNDYEERPPEYQTVDKRATGLIQKAIRAYRSGTLKPGGELLDIIA